MVCGCVCLAKAQTETYRYMLRLCKIYKQFFLKDFHACVRCAVTTCVSSVGALKAFDSPEVSRPIRSFSDHTGEEGTRDHSQGCANLWKSLADTSVKDFQRVRKHSL